ncbi:hypothetical protein AGR6A_Cc80420 [Agrobacterium sp. NCPPB 925]|nr:hypothetical protein AGR6A_Cc80420 [Agrobacterium sp. NCPPB 925]
MLAVSGQSRRTSGRHRGRVGGSGNHRANPDDRAILFGVASFGGRSRDSICLDHKNDNRRQTSNTRPSDIHCRQRIR